MKREKLFSMEKAYLPIKQKNSVQSGFSLIEIIIASGVFVLIVGSFLGVLIYFNKSAVSVGDKTRAIFLAEEGLEAARNIRDGDFSNLIDGTYGLVVSGNQWGFSGTADVTDIFTRQVSVLTVDANTKQITSQVSWDNSAVSLITYLTNWQIVVETVNSCPTACQVLDYTDGTCRQNEQRCTREGETYEASGNQYCTEGPQADTCCCAP